MESRRNKSGRSEEDIQIEPCFDEKSPLLYQHLTVSRRVSAARESWNGEAFEHLRVAFPESTIGRGTPHISRPTKEEEEGVKEVENQYQLSKASVGNLFEKGRPIYNYLKSKALRPLKKYWRQRKNQLFTVPRIFRFPPSCIGNRIYI